MPNIMISFWTPDATLYRMEKYCNSHNITRSILVNNAINWAFVTRPIDPREFETRDEWVSKIIELYLDEKERAS